MHIFFVQRFFSLLVLLVFNELTAMLTTSNKWVQKIKGQYLNGSTFQTIWYMNGSIFSKARYMIGVGFEILPGSNTRTTITPTLPPPPSPGACPYTLYNQSDIQPSKHDLLHRLILIRRLGLCQCTRYNPSVIQLNSPLIRIRRLDLCLCTLYIIYASSM